MKLQSKAALLAKFAQPERTGPSAKEKILRQQHGRADALVRWLQQNRPTDAIILPLPVKLLNGSMDGLHWAAKREIEKQYFDHCDYLAQAGLMPKPPKPIPAMWRVSVTAYGMGGNDVDNLRTQATKWPMDWLKGKWCVDDSPEYFELVEFVAAVDRKVPRLEFRTVEDL